MEGSKYKLKERVKELKCLHTITKIVDAFRESELTELLKEIVKILPDSWQYPEITGALIHYGEFITSTELYENSKWIQSANIRAGKKDGIIKISYNEKRKEKFEGPFLREERELINTIAERLSTIIKNYELQELLNENQMIFQKAIIDSPVPTMLYAEDGDVIQLSNRWTELTGYTLENTPTINDWNKNNGNNTLHEKEDHTIGENIKNGEYEVITKDGKKLIWDVSLSSLGKLSDGRRLLQSVAVDITERKKIEFKLKKSEELHRITLGSISDAVFITDIEGNFTYVCPNVNVIFGYTQKEVMSMNKLTKLIGQNNLKNKELKKLDEIKNIEIEINDKSGKKHILLLNIKSVNINGGTILYTCRDITERKHMEDEIKLSQEQLYQAQKMDALGKTASSIAHDFNNILTVLAFDTSLISKSITPEHPSFEYLDNIIKTINSGRSLTDELLLFSRKREMQPEFINFYQFLEKYLSTIKHIITKSIKVNINLESNESEVYIDPNHIKQIIMNIIINSVDAMANGGKLTIETKYIPENNIIQIEKHSKKSYMKLTITDTGIGMDEETQKHIFEPFFTTKEEGKGTGLGLAVLDSIINQSNGFIKLRSKLDVGTSISIYLPVFENNKIEKNNNGKINKFGLKSDKLIILINDNKIKTSLLDLFGSNIRIAGNLYDTLRLVKDYKDSVQLVITDLSMINLSKTEFLEKLITINPSIKVLCLTKSIEDIQDISQNIIKNLAFFPLPIMNQALINKIMEILIWKFSKH